MLTRKMLIIMIITRIFLRLAKRTEQEKKICEDTKKLLRINEEQVKERCDVEKEVSSARSENFQDKQRACIPFLLLLSWVTLVIIAVHLYQQIIIVSEKVRDVCESGTSMTMFSEELRQICLTQSNMLLLKIGLVVSSLSPVKKAMLPAGRSRPAVHFIFNTSSTEDSGLLWIKPYGFDSSSFTSLGGAYINGEVRIPETGIYTVYCSFTLSTSSNTRDEFETITQKIIRRKGKAIGEKSVMFQRQTELTSAKFEHKSISLFGNVYLEKGETVFPWLSNINEIYKMPIASYWGVFASKLKQ